MLLSLAICCHSSLTLSPCVFVWAWLKCLLARCFRLERTQIDLLNNAHIATFIHPHTRISIYISLCVCVCVSLPAGGSVCVCVIYLAYRLQRLKLCYICRLSVRQTLFVACCPCVNTTPNFHNNFPPISTALFM